MAPIPDGVEVTGPSGDRFDEILTPEALELLATAPARVRRRRGGAAGRPRGAPGRRAVRRRHARLPRRDQGRPRGRPWRVAAPAPGLDDRRVEITGPTDRKMTINALNSGAKVWLADFEDANTPLWENMVAGQLNLRDALDGTHRLHRDRGQGLRAAADDELATIVVRPRGWHLDEKHLLVDGQRGVRVSLFDFGLYLFHCAPRQLDKGKGPYFYLPKMESHLEARLWNDVFVLAQDRLGIPRGTIRATVLIETIPAAFEMEEILYELRDHSRRAQRRPLGLPVQRHQEVPHPRAATSCCPTATRSR